MSSQKKRFVFTDFETLQEVNFDKLQSVCDKLFVLINSEEENIPFRLALSMQQMGKNAKWVVARAIKSGALDHHLCYLLGKLDEKLSSDIQFAVLSDNENLDGIMDLINLGGRDCLRVMVEDTEEMNREQEEEYLEEEYEEDIYEEEDFDSESEEISIDLSDSIKPNTTRNRPKKEEQTLQVGTAELDLDAKAKETVERLKYTGNRPAEVVLLRDYIALFHQEVEEDDGQADQIINKLVETKQIEVRKGLITYNF